MILECENNNLFSFNNRTDITTDLNNYKDAVHYGQWINSMMLKWMYNEEYRLTCENYKTYLEEELKFYISFDYESINIQEDYESDFYAAAILNQELTGAEPIDVFKETSLVILNAEFVERQNSRTLGLQCSGCLERDLETSIADYLLNVEYIGASVSLQSVDNYSYLVFYGKRISEYGQPVVYIYNDENEVLFEYFGDYKQLDQEWHQYVLDITGVKGDIIIVFNGGYKDVSGSNEAAYIFSDVILY